ncbi:uncharacterized protein LOC144874133 isoform X1 [Branchiostoma floridae x Branchiostoma japonicum]
MKREAALFIFLIRGITIISSVTAGDVGLSVDTSVDAVRGDPVTLRASYTNQKQLLTLTWHKVEGGVGGARAVVFAYIPSAGRRDASGPLENRADLVGKASLRIRNVRLGDEGLYVITVMLDGPVQQEKYVYLNVLVPPTVAVGPENPYIVEWSTNVTLNCIVANSKPEITSLYWMKNGVPLTALKRSSKYGGGDLHFPSLIIRNVSGEDSGTYTCMADHVTRSGNDSLSLEVLYPAKIVQVSDTVRTQEGGNVQLQCLANGNPRPRITWSRGGSVIPSETPTLLDGLLVSRLLVRSVRKNNTGDYICSASNGLGSRASRTIRLIVEDPTVTSPAVIAIIAGATLGGVILIAALLCTLFAFKRRKRDQDQRDFSFYYKAGRQHFEYVAKEEMRKAEESPFKTKASGEFACKPDSCVDPTSAYESFKAVKKNRKEAGSRYARALYDYQARGEDELTLQTGDVYEVITWEGERWWLGYQNGSIGIFPSEYVELISENDARAQASGEEKPQPPKKVPDVPQGMAGAQKVLPPLPPKKIPQRISQLQQYLQAEEVVSLPELNACHRTLSKKPPLPPVTPQ